MEGATLRRPLRAWLSTLASGCALAVALMLMAMADGTTPLTNPSTVINLGGAAPNHQGAGNAMFPPSLMPGVAPNAAPPATPGAAPVAAAVDPNTPQLVVSVVPDNSSVTTTTTTTTTTTVPGSTPTTRRRGGRGIESAGGGTWIGPGGFGSGSDNDSGPPSTTPHRVHRIHRPHRPHPMPTPRVVTIPKPRVPKPPKPVQQPVSVSLGVRECPTPGEERLLPSLAK